MMRFSSRYRVEVLAFVCLGCVGETPPVTNCVLGTTDCGGQCVELTSSPDHCGACGLSCEPGYRCRDARCVCTATVCDGACVDPERTPSHCGACGNACGEGLVCEAGVCTARCDDELISCGGACVDARTDRQNCGACDTRCPDGARCEEGACVCGEGKLACGDRCVDTATDPDHCGACDQACGVAEACGAATCTLACGARPCVAGEVVFTRALAAQSDPVVVDDVAILANGESIVAGTFRGEIELGSASSMALGTDVFVARFDRRGQLTWLRRYGAEGVEMTVGAMVATDDRIVVVGSLDGPVTIDATEYEPDGVDALVLELSHDGLVEASEVFGGPGRQRLTAVAPTSAGLALGGDFAPGLARNGTSLGSTDGVNDRDAFILVRDGLGATAWSAVVSDPGDSGAQQVAGVGRLHGLLGAAVASDGPATVGGETIGATTPSGAWVTWDLAGVQQWVLRATSDQEVSFPRVAPEGPLMAVTHRGTLTLEASCGIVDLAVAEARDGVTFVVDPTGCPSSPTRFGGTGNQLISALAQGDATVVTGQFDQALAIQGTVAVTGADGEMFVRRLDPGGWTATVASPACAPGRCGVAIDGSRAYVLTTFTGTARRYPSPLAAAGDEGDGLLGLFSLDVVASP